jgi:hypothetical protein
MYLYQSIVLLFIHDYVFVLLWRGAYWRRHTGSDGCLTEEVPGGPAATRHFNSQQYQTDIISLSSRTSDNVIYRLQCIIPNEG